jgi:hypothetical protein
VRGRDFVVDTESVLVSELGAALGIVVAREPCFALLADAGGFASDPGCGVPRPFAEATDCAGAF